jgi:tetratricopeptide (TPR) repeat protein
MYNIKALEEEWKRYNRKKKRPWIIGSILFVVTVVLFVIVRQDSFFQGLLNTEGKSTEPNKSAALSKAVYVDKALSELEYKHKSVVVDAPIEEVSSTEKYPETQSGTYAAKAKKLHIEVVEADSRDAYREVEKRFRLGHDIDDSLFLAKAYYLKGEYKKAEYWALQTNKINENIEESWIIFVKSKVKRGHKNEAIRILNTYIQKTNSSEAKALLEKIKKNTI